MKDSVQITLFRLLVRSQIIDEVLPLLWDVRLSDPEIILRVVRKYKAGPEGTGRAKWDGDKGSVETRQNI